MKKKVFSLIGTILIFTFLFTGLAPAFADAQMQSADEDIAVAQKVLSDLNAINASKYSNLDGNVSRIDFLEDVAKIINVTDKGSQYIEYYEDVKDSYALPFINYFVESSVLSVPDDKLFHPEDAISVNEAYKIVLSVMGYDVIAKNSGGYPTGYIVCANRIGIGVSNASETAAARDLILLLYKAVNTSLYDVYEINNGQSSYKTAKDVTLLSRYHNIEYDEGYVLSANGVTLGGVQTQKGEIAVNGKRYTVSSPNAKVNDLTGDFVNVYYEKNNSGEKRNAVCVVSVDETDSNMTIDNSLVEGLNAEYKLEYYKTEQALKTSTVKIERNADVIYNGVLAQTNIRNIFSKLSSGSVKLIDADENGVYEYVVVKEYIDFVVSNFDDKNSRIYDKISGREIDFSDIENADFYSSSFSPASVSLIKPDTILSAAYSEGEFLEAVTGQQPLTGMIDEISKSNGDIYVNISGGSYKVSKDYAEKFDAKFSVGQGVKIYVNAFGLVGYAEFSSSGNGYKYGFLLDLDTSESGVKEVTAKIYTEDYSMKDFVMTEKVRVDGEQKKNYKDIINSIPGCKISDSHPDTVYPQVIRFKINDDGLINEIDTLYMNVSAGETERNSLTRTISRSNSPYDEINNGEIPDTMTIAQIGSLRRIGMTNIVNTSSKIVKVPPYDVILADEYKNYQFRSGAISELINEGTASVAGYRSDVTKGYDEFLVWYDDGSVEKDARNSHIGVVDKVVRGVNSEGDNTYRIKCVIGGAETSLDLDDDGIAYFEAMPVKPDEGDTIAVTTEASGMISQMEIIYDFSESKVGPGWAENSNIYVSGTSYSRNFQCSLLYPAYVSDKYAAFVNDKHNENYMTQYNQAADLSTVPVVVFDKSLNKNKVYAGSVQDMKTIEDVGSDNCSIVILHTRKMSIIDAVIYK